MTPPLPPSHFPREYHSDTTIPPRSDTTIPPRSGTTIPPRSDTTIPPRSDTTIPPVVTLQGGLNKSLTLI